MILFQQAGPFVKQAGSPSNDRLRDNAAAIEVNQAFGAVVASARR